ncbi:lipoprotein [Conchiformibius steedae DSM 2580]|uniref:Lipoprotein n=1 Tax=Conchiformibius steedae DSM 2580 TaxID=1121352 RepID=A0AAE9HSF3_9NEIS|nr:lipoprotein [Conchiformibius steedae]QMT32637.1 lipoprotein [Conchiformibius steedae]URD67244.1 lipoprotein [Conchiformibius steedae DSM 2580]
MHPIVFYKKSSLFIACTALLLGACGYKGDLYLPKPDDKNRFGVIQTDLSPPPPAKEAP